MKTSLATVALGLCVGAALFETSAAAPLKSPLMPLTEDMKRVLAYNELDEPAYTPRLRPKTARLHKRKLKKHVRHLHANRLIRRKAPTLARAAEPLAQFSRSDSWFPRHPFEGPYAGFAAGAQRAPGSNDTRPFGVIPPFRSIFRRATSFGPGFWGFAGFNFPVGIAVAGFEGDAGVSNPYGSLADVNGSLRARLSVATSEGLMIYATSGPMIGSFAKLNQGYHAVEPGWTTGGGLEVFVAPDLSVRFEYLHGQGLNGRFNTATIRSGVAVKF